MILFGAKCPVCRSRIQTTDVKDQFICPACGSELVSRSRRINILTVLAIVFGSPFVVGLIKRLAVELVQREISLHETYLVSTAIILLIVLLLYPPLLSASIKAKSPGYNVIRK